MGSETRIEPFSFATVVGQESAKARLRQEVAEGRVAHALLFSGPTGSGKLPLALAYARYLSCRQRTATDACGSCPSCIMWRKLVHPDVHFIFPIVNKAKSPKVSTCDDFLPQWRSLLTTTPYFSLNQWLESMDAENKQAQIFAAESDIIFRKLSLKSSQGGYKVTIIYLPEKMNVACANKLLKLLEEPPALTVFLLVSEEPDKLLSTIVSRTQRFNLQNITPEAMTEALQTRYGLSADDCRSIVHLSNGNMLAALEAIHIDEESTRYFELFVQLMRQAYARRVRELKQWSEEVASLGREHDKDFLSYCQRMLRESFIANMRNPELSYTNTAEQNFVRKFAPYVNHTNVMSIMNELSLAQTHIEQNVNARMVFFDLALKMIMLLKR